MFPVAVLSRRIVIGLALVSVLCLVALVVLCVALSFEDGLVDGLVDGVAFGMVLVTLVMVTVVSMAWSAETYDCEEEDDGRLHLVFLFRQC